MNFKVLALCLLSSAAAADFKVTSSDITAGEIMSNAQEFKGFGCNGDNLSPQLSWTYGPENTKSYAITAYDPDAPTGSGWWHWLVFNIPTDVHELPTGAGSAEGEALPDGAIQSRTDYGSVGFGGACPPRGDQAHRYQFTVFALDTDKLDLEPDSSGALVGYFLNSHTLQKTTLEALYQRP
ncbi:YbhB/YbcL family Raf kinase inhibitor-like protein [Thalassolituus sp.]|jgi:Raf kinase inhibitor-like YbhB/YbcL family protein|uniref:YbhB/YbcL family Raf kinase inhibitor-like protein n=1 Tax=Thalassolituus sp. TaxID=2030822 RepID=UPI002A816327|nr:YbhB/YbcL family Raf kinase inhibitor-like protein [Thalassolituus sp.]|tara:strand:- start:6484 stop:7026 length:543 start_codon:yes stop_codon:yes gene_type:complete